MGDFIDVAITLPPLNDRFGGGRMNGPPARGRLGGDRDRFGGGDRFGGADRFDRGGGGPMRSGRAREFRD